MRALVTGATGQLGQVCCELLTRQGWDVVGVSRSGSVEKGYKALDLLAYSRVETFISSQPPLDLVIVTHGIQQGATVGEPGFYEAYEDVRRANLDTVVYLTDLLFRYDKINPGALLIYCSSIHTHHPRASRAPYVIAKCGIEGLVRVLALEQADKGVRAVGLRLGQLSEPMAGIAFTPEQTAAIKARTPLPWVSPSEIAELCLDLYKQKSLSGAILDVDSGHSLNVWP
jgi:NAD(P)-dependent dehydrogenase (short-subunit alcohol dehydrogenase family)